MHANYFFLLDLDTESVPPPDPKTGRAQEVTDAVDAAFESFGDEWCDENNYWQHMIVVFRDGRAYQLAGGEEQGDDWRGRDRAYDPFVTSTPPEERFAKLRKAALECQIGEMGLNGASVSFFLDVDARAAWTKLEALSFDEQMALVRTAAPAKLAEAYAAFGKPQPGDDAPDGKHRAWMRNYSRKKTAQIFEALMSEHHPAPFVAPGPVYDYRAFDLTTEGDPSEAAGTAILVSDIHT
jgi:hypothetical protein